MKTDVRLKTLVLSVVFSALGPVVTFLAMTMNSSSTQIADFVRRTVELSVLIFALTTYLKIKKGRLTYDQVQRYETRIYRFLAVVLMLSASVLIFLFIEGLVNPRVPEGTVWLGLTIALLGLLFNGYFMVRYQRFNHQKESFVMDSQSKMYQAKTLVDFNVVIALSSMVFFKASTLSYWIDSIGTLLIALYLVVRALQLFKKKMPV